jgi:hypothetical protein
MIVKTVAWLNETANVFARHPSGASNFGCDVELVRRSDHEAETAELRSRLQQAEQAFRERRPKVTDLCRCPFCGKPPTGPVKSGGGDERCGYNFSVFIQCTPCGVSMSRPSHQGPAGWCDDKGEAEQAVIAAWNTRNMEVPK